MEFISNSSEETQKFAAEFAKKLKQGDIIALTGDLGAGKTTFVQGLARGLKLNKKYYVNSPTFTILNIYQGGRLPIYHFDWYRLTSEPEAADLDLDEYFYGKGVSIVEWPEKFPALLPEQTIWIKLEVSGSSRRNISIKDCGKNIATY